MLDLTSTFNGLLKKHEAPPTRRHFSLEEIDEFLKDAYRINSHISSLHTELRDVRHAYLSTVPPRKTQLRAHLQQNQRHLTDRQREEIDANAKQMLRELNASIRTLADAEDLRRETELALIRKKYSRGLSALSSWASGGSGGGPGLGGSRKSKEHAEAEERASQLSTHRESVIWFLRQRLQLCVQTQQQMMETRLTREMEKNHSLLAKARPGLTRPQPGLSHLEPSATAFRGAAGEVSGSRGGQAANFSNQPLPDEEKQRRPPEDNLTNEQLQMFEKGSQDMLKYYESTLDKVMAAEKSLLEISELQTVLVNNLATQSSHIDQLVANSYDTEENVGSGNKQLKQASERTSTARLTFFAASGLCAFLILWDLII